MPKPTNLMGANPTAEEINQREAQTITQDEIGQMPDELLTGDNGSDTQEIDTSDLVLYDAGDGLQIPEEFSGLPLAIPTSLPQNIPASRGSAYVARAHPMSPKWSQQAAAGCKEGDLYLCDNGSFTPLTPMKYFLIAVSELRWTVIRPGDGQVMNAFADEQSAKDHNENTARGNKQKEAAPHYIALCLVQCGTRLVPAKVDFRDTLLNGVVNAIRATRASYQPDWPAQSEAHRIAAGSPVALARTFHECRTYRDTAKGSGNTMYPAVCVSKPATVDQINLFLRSMKDPEFKFKVEQAKQAFNERVEAVEGFINA